MKSEQINELAKALASAQGIMEGAKKDSANPFFKSKYADLASVWEACRKPLADNGLSVAQVLQSTDTGMYIETLLMHSSGQWIQSIVALPNVQPDQKKSEAQAIGSNISYFRRYALASMIGIYQEDDDGESIAKGKPQVNHETGEVSPKRTLSVPQLDVVRKWTSNQKLVDAFQDRFPICESMSHEEFNIVMKFVQELREKAQAKRHVDEESN